jgi:hypothetical protein
MHNYWEIKGCEKHDRHLSAQSAAPFQKPISFIPEESGLYIICGPRQIGTVYEVIDL